MSELNHARAFWRGLKKHRELMEKCGWKKLGDALIYSVDGDEFDSGVMYLTKAGEYLVVSDNFETALFVPKGAMLENQKQEVLFKIFSRGWYVTMEEGVYIARWIK